MRAAALQVLEAFTKVLKEADVKRSQEAAALGEGAGAQCGAMQAVCLKCTLLGPALRSHPLLAHRLPFLSAPACVHHVHSPLMCTFLPVRCRRLHRWCSLSSLRDAHACIRLLHAHMGHVGALRVVLHRMMHYEARSHQD